MSTLLGYDSLGRGCNWATLVGYNMFMAGVAGASWARLTPLTHIRVHKWANSFRDACVLRGRLLAVARGLKERLSCSERVKRMS